MNDVLKAIDKDLLRKRKLRTGAITKTMRMSNEMSKEVQEAAEIHMTSQNTWILQAIAEKLIRERKTQK